MESLLQLGVDYWPYLLGLFFLAVTLVNMRSWWADGQSES